MPVKTHEAIMDIATELDDIPIAICLCCNDQLLYLGFWETNL